MQKTKLIQKINTLWTSNHFDFLKQCLVSYKEIYEQSFSSIKISKSEIEIDNTIYNEQDIKKILVDYYLNDEGSLSCFGDVVYMFFTDLVKTEYDILKELTND